MQDAAAYQELLDLAAQADMGEGIRQGREDVRKRRTRPARAVFDELRVKNAIPR